MAEIEIPDEDDRIYFLPDGWLRKNVYREPDTEPTRFEMLPTDDPNKYILRVTAPTPRFHIRKHGDRLK